MDNLRFGIETSLGKHKQVSMLVGQRQFSLLDITSTYNQALGKDANLLRKWVPISFGMGCHFGPEFAKQVCVVVERLNRQAGDAVLIVLPNRSGEALKAAVASVLEPMTHIRTDGLPKNSMLHGLAAKLNMDTIGKNYEEHGPLENVDRVISLLRRFLMGTYHQYCSRAHLQRFLNEFSFRFNRRYKWAELFDRTLSAAALSPPVQYAAIS